MNSGDIVRSEQATPRTWSPKAGALPDCAIPRIRPLPYTPEARRIIRWGPEHRNCRPCANTQSSRRQVVPSGPSSSTMPRAVTDAIPTIAPKPRIKRPGDVNATCDGPNHLVRRSASCRCTVWFRISFDMPGIYTGKALSTVPDALKCALAAGNVRVKGGDPFDFVVRRSST